MVSCIPRKDAASAWCYNSSSIIDTTRVAFACERSRLTRLRHLFDANLPVFHRLQFLATCSFIQNIMRFIRPLPELICPMLYVLSPVKTRVALLLFVMNRAEIIRALRMKALNCAGGCSGGWPHTHSMSDGLDSAKEL